MTSGKRRLFVQWGTAAALSPMALPFSAALPSAPQPTVARAEDFRGGGLKGFVLGGVERDPALLNAMAALGANVARVFFPLRRCHDCKQFGRSENDAQAMRRLLDRAVTVGMRLVVVGSFDGTSEATFWTDPELRASFVENWAWFATTFGGHPGLAGMDLLNEPNPPWPSGDIAVAQRAWHPLAQAAINAIRSTGTGLPIVFEPVAGGNAIGLRGLKPFADSQVVYSVHFYTPHDITHQGVAPQWARVIPYPAGLEWGVGHVNPARLETELRPLIDFQTRHDRPIYVGEFSCVRWAPGDSARRWITDALELFTKHSWSWTYHEFRGWPGWDAEIESNDPDATARSIDAPVMKALRLAMRKSDSARPLQLT